MFVGKPTSLLILNGFWGKCFWEGGTWNVKRWAEIDHHIPIHISFISMGALQDTLGVLALNKQLGDTVMAKCVLGWMFSLLQSWWILLRIWRIVKQSSGKKLNQTFSAFPRSAYHFPFLLLITATSLFTVSCASKPWTFGHSLVCDMEKLLGIVLTLFK